jgi:hypothetical protein
MPLRLGEWTLGWVLASILIIAGDSIGDRDFRCR